VTRDPEAIVRRMLADLPPHRAAPGTPKEEHMTDDDTPALDIDPGPVLENLRVVDLGGDGYDPGGFIVEGTDDEALARRMLDTHVRAAYPDHAEGILERVAPDPNLSVEARTDWRWHHGTESDESVQLISGTVGDPFTGIRFEIAPED
jgi:hypothetical protein